MRKYYERKGIAAKGMMINTISRIMFFLSITLRRVHFVFFFILVEERKQNKNANSFICVQNVGVN